MRLIPVLDIMDGQVVRGVAGDRDRYRPNTSCFVESSDPLATLSAINETFDPELIYVADLDGIRNRHPQWKLLERLVDAGPNFAVDSGAADVEEVMQLKELGVAQVVIGGESLPSLERLGEIVDAVGPDGVVFSLDLMNGVPLGIAMRGHSPRDAARLAHDAGIRHMIVLDLSSVGMNSGPVTTSLCRWLRQQQLPMRLWTGGGVRSIDDLRALSGAGIDGVLVASALHEGRITAEDWLAFNTLTDEALRASDA